jgi:hypothetical protein
VSYPLDLRLLVELLLQLLLRYSGREQANVSVYAHKSYDLVHVIVLMMYSQQVSFLLAYVTHFLTITEDFGIT